MTIVQSEAVARAVKGRRDSVFSQQKTIQSEGTSKRLTGRRVGELLIARSEENFEQPTNVENFPSMWTERSVEPSSRNVCETFPHLQVDRAKRGTTEPTGEAVFEQKEGRTRRSRKPSSSRVETLPDIWFSAYLATHARHLD